MRSALVVVMVWMVACGPSVTPPDLDGGVLDSSVEEDGSEPHDSSVPDDAHGPATASLRLILRVRTDGRVVEESGEVDIPRGRLTRFDLGIDSLAFEGDRPIAPGIRDVGTVSFITGARMVTVTPAAPGLYSGVEISLRANASGEAMDLEIHQLGMPFRLHTGEPLTFEFRCPGDAFELGVGEHVEVPLYADINEFGDELLELPVGQLADALMEGFTLACDEAHIY